MPTGARIHAGTGCAGTVIPAGWTTVFVPLRCSCARAELRGDAVCAFGEDGALSATWGADANFGVSGELAVT
jgi:hypothetical protein